MTDKELCNILENEEINNHLKSIKIIALRNFVEESLLKYGTIEKYKQANQVVDLLYKMLIKKKQIVNGVEQSFVDVLKVAGFIHNLFYNNTVSSLFLAREKLLPLAKDKYKIPDNYINSIFQAVECQLGEDTPVPQCKPIPGTPTELFAWSCWLVKQKK